MSSTRIIAGVPFDFSIHEGEVLAGHIVFDTDGVEEVYIYYGDTWTEVFESMWTYYEVKKIVQEDTLIKAIWFEKVDQRKQEANDLVVKDSNLF